MPSARLQRAVTDASAGAASSDFAGSEAAARIAPVALAVALLAGCLYAAFAQGAVASADEERLQLGLAVIALAGAVAWSRHGLSVRAPRRLWLALALLAAFAFWSGVTVLWSIAPDRTWTECNRVISYALVLVLAIALGASLERAPARIADGLLLVSLAVALGALAQKLVPGVGVSGLFSLDQTGTLPRLQEPLGYWNALALLVAFGVPCALSVVIDRRRTDALRLAAAAAATTMIVTIGFTYSRGGVLALAAALAVLVVLSGAYLRCLGWLAVVAAAALPVLLVGLNSHPLTATRVTLSARETAGAELLVLLAACLCLMLAGAHRLIALERRRRVSAAQARRIARGLLTTVAIAVIAGILAVSVSHRGLTGTVSHAWSSFTATRTTSVTNPSRLLSADSENRWVWWKEAARAFGDRPIQGWGAGSFAVVHLLYRRDTLAVQQPHSLPLQFLSETGLVGAGLGLGSLALLLAAGVAAARRRDPRSAGAAAALLAVGAAFCVHALYDWDWDIPAVTLPALIALGVVGASASSRARPATQAASRRGVRSPLLSSARLGRVALATICLVAFAVSVVVPRVAAADTARALVEASTGTPAALDQALTDARRATQLDPLSDAGLRATATIALHRGNLTAARSALLAAVGRQPSDEQAWQELALTDLARGDAAESAVAARRVAAIDPRGVRSVAGPAPPPR
ncbi:MAG TPA: O-antigen ligase family protein [Solirubrobacteraceae bacterium]|nr:O-antigen ligase family protein [Solirubrobacteraceae bacterium]